MLTCLKTISQLNTVYFLIHKSVTFVNFEDIDLLQKPEKKENLPKLKFSQICSFSCEFDSNRKFEKC